MILGVRIVQHKLDSSLALQQVAKSQARKRVLSQMKFVSCRGSTGDTPGCFFFCLTILVLMALSDLRQDKTFIIIILQVQFFGTQLAKKR